MKKIMIGKSKLSTNKLADVMYALVMCHAHLTSSHGVGIYNYTRKQNIHHSYDFLIEIDEDNVSKFEELSGIEIKPYNPKVFTN